MIAQPIDGAGLLADFLADPDRAERLTHLQVLPARSARTVAWPSWAAPEIVEAFVGRQITLPWAHQAAFADAAFDGTHAVIATGTASGKSLGYQLPALSAIAAARGARDERGATVLYLAPTKALAHDQLSGLRALGLSTRISTHDGDSSREERDWSRRHAEYLLTNPDMLHRSMLPTHERWADFFAALRFVVVDECHHYRGIFGAHVAHVLRRLRRVAAAYGADPVFMLASATVADPDVTAGRLTGLPVRAFTEDASPRGRLSVALWEPPFVAGVGENGAPARRAASSEAAELLADMVCQRVPSLAFVRSRRGVEYVAATAGDLVAEVDPSLRDQVAAYRGGYLPEERRAIEADLRAGRITGLAATNALEMGIDIHGLDAVLIAGFPGTRAAFWQQIGRAGRGADDALGVLIARADPLDTFLVHHPDALLDQAVEATVFDPSNPHVLRGHLCAAAAEVPLTETDLSIFGPTARGLVDELTESGTLRRRARGWYWTDRARACDLTDIRSTGGPVVQLIEQETGRVVGTVDSASAHSSAHPGAVYVHRGETWLVNSLDLEHGVAQMTTVVPAYTTSAREITAISIVAETDHTDWNGCRMSVGQVAVTHQVVSFLKRREPGGEVIGEHPLDLPARSLETSAVWWTIPDPVLEAAGIDPLALPGAAHAAEHCAIGLLPLFATCDRWDIGGVSTARHPDTEQVTVFVYDGHPGGAGFAERGFGQLREWLSATREVIDTCPCADGCPSCVQSPKCGNQNHPLDKVGARDLLDVLLSGAPAR
jgi:DEAD/DEAH box helicase domain-containing protein